MSLIRVFNTNPQLRMMVYMEQSSFFLGRGEGVSRSVNILLFRFHIEESNDPKLVVSLLILRRRLNGQVANVQLLRKYFARSFSNFQLSTSNFQKTTEKCPKSQ